MDEDFYLTESDLIVEYVEEKFKKSGAKLIPEDAQLKIKMRISNQKISRIISNFYGFGSWKSKSEEERKAYLSQID